MIEARIDRVVSGIRERGLDRLLVTDLTNVRYLTGFTGSNGLCVVGPDLRVFVTDFRYTEQAEDEVGGFEKVRGKQDLLADAAVYLRGRVGFDDAHLTVRSHERLQGLITAGCELVPAGGIIEELRGIKEPCELDSIRQAQRLADSVYRHVCEQGLVGRTERQVAFELEAHARRLGASGASFAPIVASGPHAALPHASPRDEPIQRGVLVIIDFGCVVDGYCSDCTRTLATGPLDEKAASVYEAVLDAQTEALSQVRGGMGKRELDATARQVLSGYGFDSYFGHGLGHGVGLEVHEAPRLAFTSEGQLSAGNVVTVEPGVYVPGELGVRIEDLVAVTETSCEILSQFPKGITTVDS
jgi:Xaa-Pro aminopeptidase